MFVPRAFKKAFKPRLHREKQFEEYYMAKFRIDSIIGHLEFEGTDQEILTIYDGLIKRHNASNPSNHIQIVNTVSHKYDPPKHFVLQCDYSELAKKMPTVDQITTYIMCKPKFEHDIVDVGKKFFDKPINSRQYGKLYRELRMKLENARKQIETTQHGAFERRSAPQRNLQIYSFRSVNATPLGLQPQKTS